MAASIFNNTAVKILKNILRFKDGTELSSTVAGYLSNITSDVQAQINGISAGSVQVAILKDERANNTDGGAATSGSFFTRTLQTEEDPSGIVTLSSNQFTLGAGTYYIHGSAIISEASLFQNRIQNKTDATTLTLGLTCQSATSVGNAIPGPISAVFTIAGSKTYELQTRVSNTKSVDGVGTPANFGNNEVYAILTIMKIG